MKEPVLGAFPEAHTVRVGVIHEGGDGEHGGAAGEWELSGVEGHGVEVDEGHGEVVNQTQEALWVRAIQDEQVNLEREQLLGLRGWVEGITDLFNKLHKFNINLKISIPILG